MLVAHVCIAHYGIGAIDGTPAARPVHAAEAAGFVRKPDRLLGVMIDYHAVRVHPFGFQDFRRAARPVQFIDVWEVNDHGHSA